MGHQEGRQVHWIILRLSNEIGVLEECVQGAFRFLGEQLFTEAPDSSLTHLNAGQCQSQVRVTFFLLVRLYCPFGALW